MNALNAFLAGLLQDFPTALPRRDGAENSEEAHASRDGDAPTTPQASAPWDALARWEERAG